MPMFQHPLMKLAELSGALSWIGPRPDTDETELARAIANQIGYPTARVDPFREGELVRLDFSQAVHVLAVASTLSLAYDAPHPSSNAIGQAACALDQFRTNAVFLSNGFWKQDKPLEWSPMTDATFDCGVLGYDARQAFIFWVEEED